MHHNGYLIVFAAAFLGCVMATPVVTRLAGWAGAIDRPDQFRRVHKGAIPRLGGLGLTAGLALAIVPAVLWGVITCWANPRAWWVQQWPVVVAAAIVLALGSLDDTRGVRPRAKLLGQSVAVLVLYIGGIRIDGFSLLGLPVSLSHPIAFQLGGVPLTLDPLSLGVTLLWFLACMNIWNLIDGMDGLASGVGLLVSGTLMLVAIREGNSGASAALAAALAGSLAGFLLYNWHPACIFLGDSGSLLLGLLIGVIGVQSSMKGTATVSILFPILAMGLPVSDTAMAIFRRWVRDLPLSAADRRHIHHLLMGLGLNPRQAVLFLYCLTGFLCGVVLLGVTLSNQVHGEFFALVLGLSGCLAFLLILTSRRDELASLLADLRSRQARKRREREAVRLTWDAIQRLELCESREALQGVLQTVHEAIGGRAATILYRVCQGRTSRLILGPVGSGRDEMDSACLRHRSPEGAWAQVILRGGAGVDAAPLDIALRTWQRLLPVLASRLAWIEREGQAMGPAMAPLPTATLAAGATLSDSPRELLPGWAWFSSRWSGRPERGGILGGK